ncbi:unnamed protein product, partial [Ectocarpus sp. 8 AP-2014]
MHHEQPRVGTDPSQARAATTPAVASSAVGSTRDAASESQQLQQSRHLEQETVRLAEKARELDAERHRLKLAAESAEKEHARAQAERQAASDATRDAATLRVALEREKTRLDAEKGGLAAERSLLAAERGRLATERSRTRREDEAVA